MQNNALINFEALVRRDAEAAHQEKIQTQRQLMQVAQALAEKGAADTKEGRQARGLLRMLAHMAKMPLGIFDTFFSRWLKKQPSRWPGYTLDKLSDWVAYFEAAGIPHIPVEVGPTITTAQLEQAFEDLDAGKPIPEFLKEAVLPWIQQVQDRAWMWRFQECAPQTIKEVLGCIRPAQYLKVTKINVPFAVDSRVLHCHWDSRQDETQLLARPWVNAVFEAGFPVEIRVFRIKETFDGKPADGWAATNYYVQRPLPEKYRQVAQLAIERTQQLEAHALNNPIQGRPAFPTSGYSVDWLLREDGELVAIEAGPPCTSRGGAHPCCFSFEGLQPGRIVLSGEPGSQFYCPPEIQAYVDRLKAGEDPESFQIPPRAIMTVLSFAAVQGDVRAQAVLKMISRAREETQPDKE